MPNILQNMAKVFFSLGSSLGAKKETLKKAIKDIGSLIGSVVQISSIYKTEPWGFEDENSFYNMAILVDSDLSPHSILSKAHEIEKKHKRIRHNTGYHSRTLDIDIIFYDDEIHIFEDLQIPHKLAHKRKFVLQPINEIQPNFVHPILGLTISQILKDCTDNSLIKIL